MTYTAGCRRVELHDDADVAFPLLAFYPATGEERVERFGPYELHAAMDAPIAEGGPYPLVVVSHGSGGSPLTHRGLAKHLARAGFVVVLPEHPRNNRNDNSLAGTAAILASRPRHVRLAIDLARDHFGAAVAAERVGVVGHSLGGYTALVLAGGRAGAGAHETEDGRAAPVPTTPDPRVAALVLLAPATPWLMAPGALRDVRVPILMLTGDRDVQAPAWHGDIVLRGLAPDVPIEHRVVHGAGHYSFLAPFPPAMTNAAFPPSQDPPGFDRAAFHAEMYAEIERFLRRTLAAERAP